MSDLSEVDFADPGIRRWLSPSAIRVFTNIAEKWNLSESQVRSLLGGIASSTLHAWKSNPVKRVLDKNAMTRISLIIGIYKALRTYFGPVADHWITNPTKGRSLEAFRPSPTCLLPTSLAGRDSIYALARSAQSSRLCHLQKSRTGSFVGRRTC